MSTINALLSSIAETEVALAHVIDAEAKKLKTIICDEHSKIEDLLEANQSAERMMRKVITKEMLLGFQLEDVVELDEIDAARPPYPELIHMPIHTGDLTVGRDLQLSAVIKPFNALNRTVTWTTSDPATAIVSTTGLVSARGEGSVTITARTANNLTETAELNITHIQPVSIGLNHSSMNMEISDTRQLNAVLMPTNTTATHIQWASNENAIASVNTQGLVIAHGPGTARITATTDNQLTAHCDVTVTS